jgi:hypothetical protein
MMTSDLDHRLPLIDRRLLEAAAYAREDWLEESARVRNAYASWSRAGAAEGQKFFAAYLSALDREGRAAEHYQQACGRLGDLALHAA